MSIRTFIALEIPEEPLNKIIDIRNKTIGDFFKIRWESKEKLHLTLKFLGETNENLVDIVNDILVTSVSKYNPFDLMFDKFGVFRKENDPKILWFGLQPSDEFHKFADELDVLLAKYGFAKGKRAFNPHITLLRFRGYEDVEKMLSLTKVILPEIRFTADKVIYFESKLLSSGSIYSPIKSFYLKN